MQYVKGYQQGGEGAIVKGGTAVTHKCVGTETSKISTFDLQQTKENVQSRFVCIKAVSPNTPVLCLETQSFHSGHRCPTTDLGQSIPLCISPILPYSTSLKESELRPNRKNVACHANLAVSNMVTPSTRNVYSSPAATSKERKLKKPARGSSSSNSKQNIRTSGVDHIKETLLKKVVSETAVQFIASTRRKISESNYNSS